MWRSISRPLHKQYWLFENIWRTRKWNALFHHATIKINENVGKSTRNLELRWTKRVNIVVECPGFQRPSIVRIFRILIFFIKFSNFYNWDMLGIWKTGCVFVWSHLYMSTFFRYSCVNMGPSRLFYFSKICTFFGLLLRYKLWFFETCTFFLQKIAKK